MSESAWVPCDVMVPPDDDLVLIWSLVGDEVDIGWYDADRGEWYEATTPRLSPVGVSHWMPLPLPPEGA